ncbi:MAG: DUF2254 domain-containing protein [Gemmatimonadaceae bacterium]
MKSRLLKYWDLLRSSFWFTPSLMAAGAVALAYITVGLDQTVTDEWLKRIGWAYSGGASGASAVLQTIAGSMITIAGVVFSLTLVALSLASSQFGPRLLRNFMRDTTNQLVLGTFVATFLYCLLILRTIRFADDAAFVPHLSVTLGVVFALASLWVLIYFIHHVSVSIQADEIVARVGRELSEGIERLFPAKVGETADAAPEQVALPALFDRESRAVPVHGDGYLQRIDAGALMALAEELDVVLRVERRPGHYLVKGSTVISAWPGERVDDEFIERVNAVVILGNQRTPAQDVEFVMYQLVEIAVRALSPGVNDPFTAIVCLDRLGSGLCRLAERDMPSPFRVDEAGTLRVVAPRITFPKLVDAAFNQIRQNSRTSAAVALRLLETIAEVAAFVRRPGDRAALRRHAAMVARGARAGLEEEEDVRAMEERYAEAMMLLQEAPASTSTSTSTSLPA